LSEQFIDHRAALGEDDAEKRPVVTGNGLNDDAVALHLELVETFQFILQQFRKNFPFFQIPKGFAEAFARFRRLP